MKKIVSYPCLLLFLGLNLLQAQTSITLNIHHLINGEEYMRGITTTNNLDHEFHFTRAEYYIAEISFIHDGGQETPVTDHYMLVDASIETSEELGEFAISELEAIRFHIGVDEARNHLDPATYPESHPLAPKFPSMHWGWTSGYRFVAIEGKSGAGLSEVWEVHALGDGNYHQIEIALDQSAVDGSITIDLDANYSGGLQNIDMNAGPLIHGTNGEAIEVLENFRDHVFSASEVVSSTVDFSEVQDFLVYPNPVVSPASPQFQLLTSTGDESYAVQLINVNGQVIRYFEQVPSNSIQALGDLQAGIYFVTLYKQGAAIMRRKLVVQ